MSEVIKWFIGQCGDLSASEGSTYGEREAAYNQTLVLHKPTAHKLARAILACMCKKHIAFTMQQPCEACGQGWAAHIQEPLSPASYQTNTNVSTE